MSPLTTPFHAQFRRDEWQKPQRRIAVLMAILTSLTIAAVLLRLASKWMQRAKLALDDVLLIVSATQMVSMNILFVIAIKKGGFGLHISAVTDEQLVFFQKSYFAAGIVMPCCYAAAKLSMLFLLHNIFAFTKFQRVVRALAIVVVCWWVAATLLDTFICWPIDSRWDRTVKGTCSNKAVQVEYFATPIPWIITDFAILVAPLPVLWGMKIPRTRQIALIVLFGFGIVTCAIACKRYVTLLNINDDDLTHSMIEPCVWTMVESSTTIICAALPASMHALRKILPATRISRGIEQMEKRLRSWRRRRAGSQRTPAQPGQSPQHVSDDSFPANQTTRWLELTPI